MSDDLAQKEKDRRRYFAIKRAKEKKDNKSKTPEELALIEKRKNPTGSGFDKQAIECGATTFKKYNKVSLLEILESFYTDILTMTKGTKAKKRYEHAQNGLIYVQNQLKLERLKEDIEDDANELTEDDLACLKMSDDEIVQSHENEYKAMFPTSR